MKEKRTYHRVDASVELPEGLRANPYTVPDGYFEHLQYQTVQRSQNEGHIPSAFDVPTGYFEQLVDSITAQVAEQKLKTIVNESGFDVPTGYFNLLRQRTAAESKIHKNVADTGFAIPTGYFDRLPNRIREGTDQSGPAVRKFSRPKWVAYAAAASIAVILGLIGIFRTTVDTPETTSPLASVSDQQILEYLALYGTGNDMIYVSEEGDGRNEHGVVEGVSAEDIEAYLNHTL